MVAGFCVFWWQSAGSQPCTATRRAVPYGAMKDGIDHRDAVKEPPKTVIVRAKTIVCIAGPISFLQYASEWLYAARAIAPGPSFPSVPYSPVPYFLYCRTIELALQAFLLAKTESDPNIDRAKELKSRELGHNLVKVLAKARTLGLDQDVATTPEHGKEVARANKYYQSKGFEYFELKTLMTRSRDLPDLQVLADFASLLVTRNSSLSAGRR